LLAAARKLLLEIIPERYVAMRVLLHRQKYVGAYTLGFLSGQYEAGKKIEGYFVYFGWLAARLVVSTGAVILFAMLFLSVVDRGGPRLLTYGSYAAILAMFLCLADTVSTFRTFFSHYKQLVAPILQRGKKTFDPEHVARLLRGEISAVDGEEAKTIRAGTNSNDGDARE
jgi:hypothetical protein